MANFGSYPQEVRDKLEKFDIECNAINDAFADAIKQKKSPPILYHYTNDIGFRGILETGIIWLANIFSLNDPSELRYGLSLALNALKSKEVNGPPEIKWIADKLADFDSQKGIIEKVAPFFVCSFSSCGNDLGQWRAYADSGRGYALGFDTEALEKTFMKDKDIPNQRNGTFPIFYDESKLARIQRRIVERMSHLIQSVSHEYSMDINEHKNYLNDLNKRYTLHALYPCIYFKHEAYINEQEYRFLQILPLDPPPNVKTRTRRYSLIKYREFDWHTLAANALKKIIGPSADKQKAYQFARDCLRSFNIDSVELTDSKIPYRAYKIIE